MKNFLTTGEAAELLGVTPRRVVAMIAAGKFPNTETIGSGQRSVHLIAVDDLALVKDRKIGRPPKIKAAKKRKQ